jgi:hypothetical protein
MGKISRRKLFAAGGPVVAATACSTPKVPAPAAKAEFRGQSPERGHRLRGGPPSASPSRFEDLPIAIVGAGAAGISAAWSLKRAGFEDFLILDLEDQFGGTARGGEHESSRYPMGAHYLPEPPEDCPELYDLLEDIGMMKGRDASGRAEFLASAICAAPTERHYHHGLWRPGLYPSTNQSDEEASEWERWHEHLAELGRFRDAEGRRAFRLPLEAGSPQLRHLDQMSMSDYLESKGFRSERLHWFVDYACRDDYGTPARFTSAYAALHHFLARGHDDGRERFLLTAPQGNANLLERMVEKAGLVEHIRSGHLVRRVTPEGKLTVETQASPHELLGFACQAVLWAAPRFLLSRVMVEDTGREAVKRLNYAPWLVANLQLDRAPRGVGAGLAWDNVPVDDLDLGYVVANHGDGLDRRGASGELGQARPHVITYYRSLGDSPESLRKARADLLAKTPEQLREEVLSALERMHSDIRQWTRAVHLHRWGHAMPRPEVGLLFSDELARLREPIGCVRACATDLSGIALLEEAFYRGRSAALAALESIRQPPPAPAPTQPEP